MKIITQNNNEISFDPKNDRVYAIDCSVYLHKNDIGTEKWLGTYQCEMDAQFMVKNTERSYMLGEDYVMKMEVPSSVRNLVELLNGISSGEIFYSQSGYENDITTGQLSRRDLYGANPRF